MILILIGKTPVYDMKRFALYFGLAAALVASCSTQEKDFQPPLQDDVVFYASFEQPVDEGTRVYANEDLLLRWTADDRISIFNKNTYNQQYRFAGETGDNAGGFDKVAGSEFATGNAISHVVSVYPYQSTTKISESESVTLTLPAEQHFAENTFGLDANTMVAVSEDNNLQFKNVGGFLRISLFGKGITVSSITLKGNNGEKIAGKATLSMSFNGLPTVEMTNEASTAISLICYTPIDLNSSVENSKDFWFVIPPITFSKGFSITVFADGGVYEKVTNKSITISRNNLSKMAPIEVEKKVAQPNNVIYYTSSDGSIVTPNSNANFGAKLRSNEYYDGVGIMTFSGDVTTVGGFNYSKLTSISLPGSVIELQNGAFSNSTKLMSVTLPTEMTRIGTYAFSNCSNLKSVSIPDGVPYIAFMAFENCSNLESITLPSSVTEIRESAFSGCSKLASISLPDNVSSIWSTAFTGCSNLSSVSFSRELISIGRSAFEGCTQLKSISLPDKVLTIGDSAFSGCSGLSSVTFSKGLTSIGASAFKDCKLLESVILSDSVVSIGAYAFYGCSRVSSVVLSRSMTSLGKSAFYNCSSIPTIELYEGISTVEVATFENCSSLTSVTIPEGVIAIETRAFRNCSKLEDIFLPESITSVGDSSFSGCSSIRDIVIPRGVESIKSYAFSNCDNLERVLVKPIIPPKAGTLIFSSTSLKYVFIPQESFDEYNAASGWKDYSPRFVISGDSVIHYTTSDGCLLEPTSLSYMDAELVENTYTEGVGSLRFNGIVTKIGKGAFQTCTNLATMVLPNSVTFIGESAFRGCTGLTSVTVPESTTIIGPNAFQGCSSLTAITIPKSVTRIYDYAFTDCTGLERIDVVPSSPPIGGKNMFLNTDHCPIYIPAGSETPYSEAEYWNKYILRMRVFDTDAPVAYSSTDFSQNGEVSLLQQATVGRGINIILMGDGFLDRDMGPDGKYEQKMKETMEQFFSFEPYYSFRDRFNVYSVKVVSKNDIYWDELASRSLTYEEDGKIYYRISDSFRLAGLRL